MALGLCNALVAVIPWSVDFLLEYSQEKYRLQDCIGVSNASFEHIGSTAIPGLAAKPIIDIMVTVCDVDQYFRVSSALTEHGYTCLGECGRPGRLFIVRGIRTCLTTHHIHLVLDGSNYQSNHLAIREALAADTALATEYANLKLRLAGEYPLNRMMYRFNNRLLKKLVAFPTTLNIPRI